MSNPDFKYWDPGHDYTSPNPAAPHEYLKDDPPRAFLKALKAIDANLSVCLRADRKWLLGEIMRQVLRAESPLVGPDGRPIIHGDVPFFIVVEFGECRGAVPSRDDLDDIRRWSPRFHPEGNIGARRDDEAVARIRQEAVLKDAEARQWEAAGRMRKAFGFLADEFGAPLASRENMAALARRAEVEDAKERARVMRQIVPAHTGMAGAVRGYR